MRASPSKAVAGVGVPPRLGVVIQEALRRLQRSPEDLAEAIQVSPEYVSDLLAGRRRPPLPGRTDVYDRMASYLRLSRQELEASALAERTSAATAARVGCAPEVAEALLALCEPATARELKRRGNRDGGAELARLIQRVLDVVQGLVRRMLDEQVGLRVAAVGRGMPYVRLRVSLLEFLDATPETLTLADLTEQITPRVGHWDVDLETDVVRVVLRPNDRRDSGRRRPQARRGFMPRD